MSTLGGHEKAAILILGLDKQSAASILKQLDDDELVALRAACEKIGAPALEQLGDVINQFSAELRAPAALMQGSPRYLRDLLLTAVGPERARKVVPDGKRGPSVVERLEPKLAAALLEREHPQAVSALLYHLDETVAGKILQCFSPERVTDIVTRIAALTTVSDEALLQIEETLAATIGDLSVPKQKASGVSKAATLVNSLDTVLGTKVLDAISETDAELGKRVRDARFTIDDIARADAKGVQLVLREIESDKLLLALKTASAPVREKFLSCVSSRVADSLREELVNQGPVRLKDVEAAQKRIVEVALQLQKDGKLLMPGGQGDDFV